MTAPATDQIEVIVFGPGYGECILVHVGSNQWVVFDSCLDAQGKPAAITYLESIGADPSTAVAAVVASHWHDDHIKGLSAMLGVCKAAVFVVSAALRNDEFRAFLKVHDNQPVGALDRGGTEILKCMTLVQSTRQKTKPVFNDTIIKDWDASQLAHGKALQIRALSPSARQYDDHLVWVAQFLAEASGSNGHAARKKKRIAGTSKNDLSIAALLHLETVSILFGADVEEQADPDLGWSAIVESRRGREPRSSIFKVAHHGSSGAHLESVWSDILTHNTISIVTPWQLGGRQLPTPEDKVRLARLSQAAYITSSERRPVKRRYDRQVMKLITHGSVDFGSALFKDGHVRLVISPDSGEVILTELVGTAIRL